MAKIFIGSDHAGCAVKSKIIECSSSEHPMQDLGTFSENSADYPDYAKLVCENVLSEAANIGVLICSTGIGMSIIANRYKGIRAALCRNLNDVKLARQHNNANVLVIGASTTSGPDAVKMLNLFLKTAFEGGRHLRRINLIDNIGE